MARELWARIVPAREAGMALDTEQSLPDGITLIDGRETEAVFLPAPFHEVPVLPATAGYRGEPIGVLIGRDLLAIDEVRHTLAQSRSGPSPQSSGSPEGTLAWSIGEAPDEGAGEPAHKSEDRPEGIDSQAPPYQIVEGHYRAGTQPHLGDAPLWAHGHRVNDVLHISGPMQWPSRVRAAVAAATGWDPSRIHVRANAPSGNRDGALLLPLLLAALAARASIETSAPVRLSLTARETLLTGGRSPAEITLRSRFTENGEILTSEGSVSIDHGRYATFAEETQLRASDGLTSLYAAVPDPLDLRGVRSRSMPLGPWEGVASAQVAFAREVHMSRIAGLIGADPIDLRIQSVRPDRPLLGEVCAKLATEADTRRRYAANELARKRHGETSPLNLARRGIGVALASQLAGSVVAEVDEGYISLRLEQDRAVIGCSLPTPTERLRNAWRLIVARALELDLNAVELDASIESPRDDSGPRWLSRGVALVAPALQSMCQSVQRKRFRAPLPIEVRRALRGAQGKRTPADQLRAVGAGAVEVAFNAELLETTVRSVTLVVYAGRILDRTAAEMELRRGIYQALAWTLDERTDLSEGLPTIGSFAVPRGEVRQPQIKVTFMTADKRSRPVGIGEIPFLVVPAATIGALSQASGLYLDSIPVRPATMLSMLAEGNP